MSASNDGMSAASLAAAISGSASRGPQVQRFADLGSGTTESASTRSSAPSGSTSGSTSGSGTGQNLGAQLRDSDDAAEWFSDQLDRNFDRLVTALEDRMIVEFERRGGRIWEGL